MAEGSEPQFEHRVYSGEINGIPFVNPKPCDRCPITKVDQETGKIIDEKYWPETILNTYKRWKNLEGKNKVIFGENMAPLRSGIISKGDQIKVTAYRDPPLVYGGKAAA